MNSRRGRHRLGPTMPCTCRWKRSLLCNLVSLVVLPETVKIATITTAKSTAAAAAAAATTTTHHHHAAAFQLSPQGGDRRHHWPPRRRRTYSSYIHGIFFPGQPLSSSSSTLVSVWTSRPAGTQQLRAVELGKTTGDGAGRWETGGLPNLEGGAEEGNDVAVPLRSMMDGFGGVKRTQNCIDVERDLRNAEQKKEKEAGAVDHRATSASRPSWRACDLSNTLRPGGNATSTSGNATATAQHGELVSDDIVGRWKALPVFSEDAATAAAAAAAVAAGAEAGDSKEKMGTFDFAPPMTVQKYKTMQERRVLVVIKYTGGGGFKRYYEEIVCVLKKHFPDVRIEREIIEGSTREEEVFEISVDGKLVCAKRRGKAGVYLRMETVGQTIRKARQRRRPGAIVYGDKETYRNAKPLGEDRASTDGETEASSENGPGRDLLGDT